MSSELVNDIVQSDNELKNYLGISFADMYNNRSFHDALPGHFVQYGSLANERIELFSQKIEKIFNL